MLVILPCTWHGYHFGTLYGCPKYSLYLRLLNRWDSSGHRRCNRKNETLVYQKRNLDLLLLKCKVQNEKKPVYSHSFASYTNGLEGGGGCTRAIMRYSQMETALWEGGREGWRLRFTRYNFFGAMFRTSMLFALPLIRRIFLSKGKLPVSNICKVLRILRQSLPNAQGPNTWLTLVLSIRWNRSELFNNNYINNIYFVFQ